MLRRLGLFLSCTMRMVPVNDKTGHQLARFNSVQVFTMRCVFLFLALAVHTLLSWMLGWWTAFWSACARTSSTSRRMPPQIEMHTIYTEIQERARILAPKAPQQAR